MSKKKSLEDEINEEIDRMLEEDAILMGDVAEASPPDAVSSPSEKAIDNSVQKNHKVDDHSITFSDTLGDYKPGDGVMSAKNNYTGNGLSAMNIQKRIPESNEEAPTNFKEHFLESDLQGLEHWDSEKLMEEIVSQIHERMNEGDVSKEDAEIKNLAFVGSRNRNTAKEDSDLDVVVEYEGSIREDDLSNTFNGDNRVMVDDIVVDVNPIRKQESGTMKDFLAKSKEYDDYVLSNTPLTEKKKGKKKNKKRQHFRRYYGYYPFWPIIPVRPIPPPPPPKPDPEPTPDPSPDVPTGGGEISGGDVPSGGAVAAGPVGEKQEEDTEEQQFNIGDRVRIVDNIRCMQKGKSGKIIQKPEWGEEYTKHGEKLYYVEFDDPKYHTSGWQSAYLVKLEEDKKKEIQESNSEKLLALGVFLKEAKKIADSLGDNK